MLKKIKIVSNPYKKEIKYFHFNDSTKEWENIIINNPNSRLRETESEKCFFPFKIKNVIDIIIDEYYAKNSKIKICFEGTDDEFQDLKEICNESDVSNKVTIERSPRILDNAEIIFNPINKSFDEVQPIIEKVIGNNEQIRKNLNKVSDALKDIIPICVFGNYSMGKSTFINALIGYEILPSGGTSTTSKIYKISRSKNSDMARIEFEYNKESYEIYLKDGNYKIQPDEPEISVVQQIKSILEENDSSTMITSINLVLDFINNYEEKNKLESNIGNIIEIETPFSKEEGLGQSYYNFVIFDTPGSNTETNLKHKKVLEEALEGFSNGIPVWISTYESVDSMDDANLCEKLLDIKALDKRFTMIIFNKADGSDLANFNEQKEKIILGYNSVKKMYASGIYFLSSIMGIGAKNNGQLIDRHYRRIYRSQHEMYSNPEDEDYMALYKYNIMPKQIKNNVLKYSLDCNNLIYANSGLLCVEKEIEKFAEEYVYYNKCQMVYIFLKEVIKEANKNITVKTEELTKIVKARKDELSIEKQRLIDNIKDKTNNLIKEYQRKTNENVKNYADKKIDYFYKKEEMLDRKEKINQEKNEEKKLEEKEEIFDKAKASMHSHMKNDLKNMFDDGFFDTMKNTFDDLQKDYSEIKAKKEEMNKVKNLVNEETSDEFIELVVQGYRKNAIKIRDKLLSFIEKLWRKNAKNLKNQLIKLIDATDTLSEDEKKEISQIIISFSSQKIEDNADEIFKKSKYLSGKLFGFRIYDTEKINGTKLINSYNSQIKKFTDSLAEQINKNCENSFIQWKENLELLIIKNISKYNPSLRAKTDLINEDNKRIIELRDSQQKIKASLDNIEDLMSWKNIE